MKKTYTIVIAILCIGLIVGGYVFWMKQNEKPAGDVELSVVQKMITKDLKKNYQRFGKIYNSYL